MAYLLLDDVYDTHAKVLALSEVERWRWTRVLLHCARHHTEGRVHEAVLTDLGLSKSLGKLVAYELLIEVEDELYAVHDWHVYNGALSLDERVTLYLRDHPGASANEVVASVPGRRASILAVINRLNGSAP